MSIAGMLPFNRATFRFIVGDDTSHSVTFEGTINYIISSVKKEKLYFKNKVIELLDTLNECSFPIQNYVQRDRITYGDFIHCELLGFEQLNWVAVNRTERSSDFATLTDVCHAQ